MGIYIHQNNTAVPVGGAERDLSARVAELESRVAELAAALAQKLDAGRVTQEATITQAGYAADARELNPANNGSLAHEVSKIRDALGGKGYLRLWRGVAYSGETVSYQADLGTVNYRRIVLLLHKDDGNCAEIVELPRCAEENVANYFFSVFGGVSVRITPRANSGDLAYMTSISAEIGSSDVHLWRIYAELA